MLSYTVITKPRTHIIPFNLLYEVDSLITLWEDKLLAQHLMLVS